MKVQVLVASMNQTDCSLIDKMNIKTDVIIGNQGNYNSIEEFEYKGHKVKCLSFAEKGVGLNRNNALMRADADICLFADDDMKYVEDYEELIIDAFERNPKADVIVFNINGRSFIKKASRVNRMNYLRYGTARIAIRLKSIRSQGIFFNQCFGGGTDYCHGEDNLFLAECLKKGLKIYAEPILLATLQEERASTWNSGNIIKYLKDQGVLYKTLSKRWYWLLCLQDAIRRKGEYGTSWLMAFRIMIRNDKMR